MLNSRSGEAKAISILLVDDDPDLRVALEDFLKEQGHSVTCCTSCRHAKAVLSCSDPSFNIILTDLILPDGEGLEIIRLAKQRDPGVVAALMTGYASLESALEAIRIGAYDYITKPFNFDEIEILIHNMSEKVRLVEQNRRAQEQLQQLSAKIELIQDEKIELLRFTRDMNRQFERVLERLDQVAQLVSARQAPLA